MKEMGRVKITRKHINPGGVGWGWLLKKLLFQTIWISKK